MSQNAPFIYLLAIMVMASTNAKSLSSAVVAGIAMLLGYQIYSPQLDYGFSLGVFSIYVVSHVLSAFRS